MTAPGLVSVPFRLETADRFGRRTLIRGVRIDLLQRVRQQHLFQRGKRSCLRPGDSASDIVM